MILFVLLLVTFHHGVVMSSVVVTDTQCVDWKGIQFFDGERFYPSKDDPCYSCLCQEGHQTMCKTVSCLPPSCPHIKTDEECCHFECIDKNGVSTDNITGRPSGGSNNEVVSTLECIDWIGNKISDGERFYPYKDDHCYSCLCHQGFETMCKTVSCLPPSCPHIKTDEECCHFECIDKNGVSTDNITGRPSGGSNNEGTPTDSTMTDLGLRLVASTVTTFLILALLLFLIHRFRQRRLLMTLRRYSQGRRDPLDDLDSINYTPDFFDIHRPPYEDPPPPYTPPKPQPGEEPPPYEAIEGEGNQSQNGGHQGDTTVTSSHCDRNCHNANRNLFHSHNGNINSPTHIGNASNTVNGVTNCSRNELTNSGGNIITSNGNIINCNGNVIPANGSPGNCCHGNGCQVNCRSLCGNNNSHVRGDGNHTNSPIRRDNSCNQQIRGRNSCVVDPGTCTQQDHAGCRLEHSVDGTNTSVDNNPISVHFRNSTCGQPGITMGVLNRNRNNRHRYSDGLFNSTPVRNSNHRNTLSENTAALNLELRNTVRNYRNNCEHESVGNGVNHEEYSSSTTDIGESTTSAESLSSTPESPNFDARNTDRHSVDILGDDANSTVKRFLDRQFGPLQKHRRYPTTMSQSWTSSQISPNGPNFRQSISLGSFPPKSETQSTQQSSTSILPSGVTSSANHPNLSRSKSEHLKTNGSLINQPYKGGIKSPTRAAPYPSHGVRVAYKEPDELSSNVTRSNRNSCNMNMDSARNHSLDNIVDVSVCSNTSMDSGRLATALLDPGDIIVTRRQDELRKLRLTHLLDKTNPPTHGRIDNSNARSLQRSFSENSVNSATILTETGDHDSNEVTISNDSQYPVNSYKNFLHSCITSAGSSSSPESRRQTARESKKKNTVSTDDTASGNTSTQSSCKSTPKRENRKKDDVIRGKFSDNMIHSWHGGHVDSGDENISVGGFSMNTIGRNVNRKFDKKTCLDKDMSNMFFPLHKPTNSDQIIDRNSVPSSKMRACASQLYNYETEERSGKKDKKRNLFKRHSAGCFPVKNDSQVCTNRSPRTSQKQYQRLKSSKSQERHSNNHHRMSENHTKENPRKRVSSKDRKSGQKLLQNSMKDSPTSKVTDLTPPFLVQSYPPPDRPTSLNVHTIDMCDRTDLLCGNNDAQTQTDKWDKKRSKSLGRNDSHSNHRSSSGGRSSQSRKKKHSSQQQQQQHNGVLETHLFQQELDSVLSHRNSQMKSSSGVTSQTRSKSNMGDRKCAITQV
ncbi:hypothetical protein ACF0H5_016598 [Mactra antiquata]